MTDIERKTRELLIRCGVTPSLSGYEMIVYAISEIDKDIDLAYHIGKLYKLCGERFKGKSGSSGSAAERAIRHAIEKAFDNAHDLIIDNLKAPENFKSGKYCNKEFLLLCYERLKLEDEA